MSVATIATILTEDIATEFAAEYAVSETRINRFISRAMLSVNSEIAGDRYDEAVAYLVAHRLTMISTKVDKAGGQLQSKRLDNAAKTYAVDSGSGPNGETRYGREFDRIMESMPVAPLNLYEV